ncbi:protein of unassigned function [Methylobacterium oryzae CBMB20]|uniref:Protein of unassigned function n=1 Tax=Methylobacterium oryzae CBMB20 TaxID=693986 RepID=A0A089P519_9HYPH|nr:protein of unassigned function [Methylobacterium oryzae CBMB20]
MQAAIVKYRWAATHIQKLLDIEAAYAEDRPYQVVSDPTLPDGMVKILISRQPPAEIGLVVGDIVHSLRGALDYGACALVKLSDARNDTRLTQFPFGRVGMALNSNERRQVKGIRDRPLAFIEQARAIAGPVLHVLQKASNQDKHRLILPSLLRRLPVKIQVDNATNTAEVVIDESQVHLWAQPIANGDAVELGNMLALRTGFEIEGDAAPYYLGVIDHLFIAVHIELAHMIAAAAEILLPTVALNPAK